jgi:hypothetical protein
VTTPDWLPADHLWEETMAFTSGFGFTARSTGSSRLCFPSFTEHFDFHLPGTHLADGGLMRNLPLFRVLSAIEQPGTVQPGHGPWPWILLLTQVL